MPLPDTVRFPPIVADFSTPSPPSVTIAPVSLLLESVVPVTVRFPLSVGFVGIDNVTAASAFVTVI